MKTKILELICIALLISGCRSEVEPVPNEVVLSKLAFTPNSIRVPLGTTISWINNDATTYTVTSDSTLFDSGDMIKGNVFSYVFNKAGTFTYHSKYQNGMIGTIIVQSDTIVKEVSINQFAFSPASLTVNAGTVVKWTNNDPVSHTVTSEDGTFDSGIMNQGAIYSHTFNAKGSFPYHCHLHPSMTATVVVQ